MERPHIPWYACCIERKGTSPLTESLREKQFWENWIKITDGVTQCHSNPPFREYWTLWNKFDLNIFAICPLSNKVKTLSLSVPLKEHFLNNDPANFFSPTQICKTQNNTSSGSTTDNTSGNTGDTAAVFCSHTKFAPLKLHLLPHPS